LFWKSCCFEFASNQFKEIGQFGYYPNLNPNFRVPEMSGFYYSVQISGNNYQNPKFQKPEKPDPKFSGYPNAHP